MYGRQFIGGKYLAFSLALSKYSRNSLMEKTSSEAFLG